MRRRKMVLTAAAVAALAVAANAIAAGGAPQPRKERVNFAKGASSATVKGTLKGYADVDYLVRAGAGQTLEVKLEATHAQNDFNVLPPGSTEGAMFSSNFSGQRTYSGVLPTDGDYAIRVYINRAAARRSEASRFTLTVTVSGKALPPLPAARDAKVAGTAYHATAQVNCVPPYATAATLCDAGVIRRGTDGTATVELRGKNPSVMRRILFVQGKATAADSMDPVTASKQGDLNTVKVGEERYDVPDAFLTGG
jgi:hypothetical protein